MIVSQDLINHNVPSFGAQMALHGTAMLRHTHKLQVQAGVEIGLFPVFVVVFGQVPELQSPKTWEDGGSSRTSSKGEEVGGTPGGRPGSAGVFPQKQHILRTVQTVERSR